MAHIDEITRRQRGVLTRVQAHQTGISDDGIRHRLSSGRWQRLLPGTYATFSGEVSRAAWRWAAVLRAGPGAVLSHRAAAEEIGLIAAGADPIHVTIPGERRVRPAAGLLVHRSRHVSLRRHPTRLPPQTRVEETVLDLATTVGSQEEAMGWIAAACGGRFTTPDRIAHALTRRMTVAHRRDLALLLSDAAGGCNSVLEWRYLRTVERVHGLPTAVRQQQRGGWYDDVCYADHGVRVELDGAAAHPAERRWRDFRRDNAAVQDGEAVLRYGAADVRERPCEVAAQVARVLRSRGWPGRVQRCGQACEIRVASR